jgi:galactokinase
MAATLHQAVLVQRCRLSSVHRHCGAFCNVGAWAAQEKALQLQTLRELEPVVAESAGGQQRAGELELCQEAVRRHLHEGAYQQDEIEEALGTTLQQLFDSSPSSQRQAGAVIVLSSDLQLLRQGSLVWQRPACIAYAEDHPAVAAWQQLWLGNSSAIIGPCRTNRGQSLFMLMPPVISSRRLQWKNMQLNQQAELGAMLYRAVKASGGVFKLRDRALHVYSEAARVPRFRDACNAEAGADDTLRRLGDLMNASHASCRCHLDPLRMLACSDEPPQLGDLTSTAAPAATLLALSHPIARLYETGAAWHPAAPCYLHPLPLGHTTTWSL